MSHHKLKSISGSKASNNIITQPQVEVKSPASSGLKCPLDALEQHLDEECAILTPVKRVLSAEENKNGYDTFVRKEYVVDISPTVRNAFKGMFEPNKTYRFRLTRVASIVTSGGGTLALATGVYPGQFDQYTALSILFGQSRLIRTSIEYMLLINTIGSTSIPAVAVSAFDTAQYGGTTYLYNQLQRRAGCKQLVTSYTGNEVMNSYTTKKSARLWSDIAVQTGTDPFGGNSGAWCIAFANAASATTSYYEYLISADYEFTSLRT
jgi:hypothetical protein